jgi:hypothetical protein
MAKQTVFINLETHEWRQNVRADRARRYGGRALQMSARATKDHGIELVGAEEKLDNLIVHLSILEGEPTMADGKPLDEGIGLFVFNHSRPGGHDYDDLDAMVVGWFFLDTDLYNEVWSQVAADRYSDCTVTVTIGPITFESDNWAWDVKTNKRLFIEDVSITFVRDKTRPAAEQQARKRGLFRRVRWDRGVG